jgi:hypothetical protein
MPTLHVCANDVQKISSVILNVILTAPAKINFAAVLYYAYVTCIFHQYITELVNCSFTETFHSLVRLTSHRVVAVKGKDHNAFWQIRLARTRCGRSNRFLQQPRREFRIMVFIHLPQRVVAVSKRPQREISCCGCFAFVTTRSGCLFRPLSVFGFRS